MENNDQQESESEFKIQNAPQLSVTELRVLGALMEKQLTTPDGYPLTLNSIVTACNQKSSRDPISHYELGELKRTLQILEDKTFVHREYSSRSEKYSQRFIKYLELGKKQQALLCVMMLRGPQTISELATRTQRMCEFTDRDELEHSIDRLCSREIPYAIRLGQQAGQRGERIGHLFSGIPAVATYHETVSNGAMSKGAASPALNADHNETLELLTLEVADLQKKVHALETQTSELERQLTELYLLTGNKVSEVD